MLVVAGTGVSGGSIVLESTLAREDKLNGSCTEESSIKKALLAGSEGQRGPLHCCS